MWFSMLGFLDLSRENNFFDFYIMGANDSSRRVLHFWFFQASTLLIFSKIDNNIWNWTKNSAKVILFKNYFILTCFGSIFLTKSIFLKIDFLLLKIDLFRRPASFWFFATMAKTTFFAKVEKFLTKMPKKYLFCENNFWSLENKRCSTSKKCDIDHD